MGSVLSRSFQLGGCVPGGGNGDGPGSFELGRVCLLVPGGLKIQWPASVAGCVSSLWNTGLSDSGNKGFLGTKSLVVLRDLHNCKLLRHQSPNGGRSPQRVETLHGLKPELACTIGVTSMHCNCKAQELRHPSILEPAHWQRLANQSQYACLTLLADVGARCSGQYVRASNLGSLDARKQVFASPC